MLLLGCLYLLKDRGKLSFGLCAVHSGLMPAELKHSFNASTVSNNQSHQQDNP
jgi:hypothetical protein